MSKKYHWLKLPEDFFQKNKRIKKIHKRLPAGDTYIVIYLKMLLESLKNDGYLILEGVGETPAEEIALLLDEGEETIETALNLFQIEKLITMTDESVFMNEITSMIGAESSSAQRVRNFRERQKALQCNTNVTTETVTCNKNVTLEEEIEIDIEKDNLTISNDIVCRTEQVSPTEITALVEDWNTLSQYGIPQITRMGADSKRYKMLLARVKEYSVDEVHKAIDMIRRSPYLQGRNRYDWAIDFDWFVKPTNFAKVHDGNYLERSQTKQEETQRYGWMGNIDTASWG